MKLSEYIDVEMLRQDKFAAKIGITPSQLSSYLAGRNEPNPTTAEKISVATNRKVTVQELIPSLADIFPVAK